MKDPATSFYNTQQAAELLAVSPSRVRQLISEKMINARKIGRDHIILGSDIKKYIAATKKNRGRPRNVNK